MAICGNLINTKNTDIAREFLEPGAFLVELNENWSCIIGKGDKCGFSFGKLPVKRKFSNKILDLSSNIPVLYVKQKENGNFYFAMLYGKNVISQFRLGDRETPAFRGYYVDYEVRPDKEITSEIIQGTEETLKTLAECGFGPYADGFKPPDISNIFSNLNLDNFKLLGCSDGQITELKKIFDFDYCDKHTMHMGDRFLNVLDIKLKMRTDWESVNDNDLRRHFNLIYTEPNI